MELNKRTIVTVLKAIKIAKHTVTMEFSKSELQISLKGIENTGKIPFLESQVSMIDMIDEFEKLERNFQELANRQNYQQDEK